MNIFKRPSAHYGKSPEPDRTLDLLFRFLHQNGGKLSGRARAKEFAALTEEEADRIEAIYAELQEEF